MLIEDLGSKNGTFVGAVAVTGPRRVDDGDRIRIGPVEMELRTSSRSRATETDPDETPLRHAVAKDQGPKPKD